MTKAYDIRKYGPYRRGIDAPEIAQTPPKTPPKPRVNAYLALMAYMQGVEKTIKR